jgi:hypothetical protein
MKGSSPEGWTAAAREFDGGSFRISYEWKEMLTYWEEDHGFVFDCAWGVSPGDVYVPAEDLWDTVVPPWLVGRRAEVMDRLLRHSGHAVKDYYVDWYRPGQEWRLRTR